MPKNKIRRSDAIKAKATAKGRQTTLRLPARVTQRVVDAMEFEGIENFSQFAINSLVRNCRRIEIEKKREQAGLPPVDKAW